MPLLTYSGTRDGVFDNVVGVPAGYRVSYRWLGSVRLEDGATIMILR